LCEPKNKEIRASITGASVTVFEAATARSATIPLRCGGIGQADRNWPRVREHEDKNSVDVIDIATHKVTRTAGRTGRKRPPAAIDLATIACRRPEHR
jgi:hypothetical protein